MYLDYFGLKEAPFRITPNTEYWYAGGQRGETLAALVYAIGQGEGIIKVVGEVGSGKTMLCRMLVAKLPDTIDSVYLGNPALAPDEMLAAILADLGVAAPEAGRHARLAQLNQVLLARHESGRRVVVFAEEAQGISLDNLEFLRLLTNLETATDKLLQIVLFGQPELDAMLADPRIRQLKDRITQSLKLSPLNESEVADYLRARLAVAGYRGPDLFPPKLVARMARLSRGLSRRINVLADKTLLAAYAGQTRNLRLRHLAAAMRDAEASSAPAPASRKRHAWGWLLAGLAAGLGLLAFVAWQALEAPPPGSLSARPSPTPPAASPNTTASAPAPANTPDMTALASQTGHWLARAAPETFVIQLASAKDAAEAAVLLQEFGAPPTPQPLRVLYGLSQGRAAWMILAGEFPGRNEAMAALQSLPEQNSGSRFLRTVGKMRTVVLPSG
jgi:type II secretory pathway predicted ATPase ExeA